MFLWSLKQQQGVILKPYGLKDVLTHNELSIIPTELGERMQELSEFHEHFRLQRFSRTWGRRGRGRSQGSQSYRGRGRGRGSRPSIPPTPDANSLGAAVGRLLHEMMRLDTQDGGYRSGGSESRRGKFSSKGRGGKGRDNRE